MAYYVSHNGRQLGPLGVDALMEQVGAGNATDTDLVWAEGWSQWKPLGSVAEFKAQLADALARGRQAALTRIRAIVVTTIDLKEPYEIVGPIYFQLSNKGMFRSSLSDLLATHQGELRDLRASGQLGQPRGDWGFLWGQYSAGQNDFDKAFFVAVQELKKRAAILGADAIVGFRQAMELDTNGFQFFYLQVYGTAVRRL